MVNARFLVIMGVSEEMHTSAPIASLHSISPAYPELLVAITSPDFLRKRHRHGCGANWQES